MNDKKAKALTKLAGMYPEKVALNEQRLDIIGPNIEKSIPSSSPSSSNVLTAMMGIIFVLIVILVGSYILTSLATSMTSVSGITNTSVSVFHYTG